MKKSLQELFSRIGLILEMIDKIDILKSSIQFGKALCHISEKFQAMVQ